MASFFSPSLDSSSSVGVRVRVRAIIGGRVGLRVRVMAGVMVGVRAAG